MDNEHGDRVAQPIPSWSWLSAAVGLALVVGAAGFLLFQAFAGDTSPPELVIEADAVVVREADYLVPIRVMNRGGRTAANLVVEGVLSAGGATVEASTITLTYVPAGSRRAAGLLFAQDPRQFELRIRARGYELP